MFSWVLSCLDMVFYSHWNIDSCVKLPAFSGFERWDNCGTRRSGWSKSWTPDSQCIPTYSNALFGLDWQFPSCKRPKILGSGRPGQVISWATWRIQSRTLAAQCCFHQCSDQWKNIETTWENLDALAHLDTSGFLTGLVCQISVKRWLRCKSLGQCCSLLSSAKAVRCVTPSLNIALNDRSAILMWNLITESQTWNYDGAVSMFGTTNINDMMILHLSLSLGTALPALAVLNTSPGEKNQLLLTKVCLEQHVSFRADPAFQRHAFCWESWSVLSGAPHHVWMILSKSSHGTRKHP